MTSRYVLKRKGNVKMQLNSFAIRNQELNGTGNLAHASAPNLSSALSLAADSSGNVNFSTFRPDADDSLSDANKTQLSYYAEYVTLSPPPFLPPAPSQPPSCPHY